MTLLYIVLATLAGGLLSVGIAASLTVHLLGRVVKSLVSLSAGVLLATALLNVLPEAFESQAEPHALFATLLGGLLFFEKAAVIPFVAFAVVALLYHVAGEHHWLATVWQRGIRLWTSTLVSLAGWIVVYLVVVDQQRWSWDLTMTWNLLRRSFTHGIVPGLVGGPWQWQRWAPASPWAVPPTTVMALGWLALAAVLVVSVLRKRRLAPVWLAALGYAAVCQVPIYLMRSSRFTALELAQTLRYQPDLVFVLAITQCTALMAAQPTWAGLGRGLLVLAVLWWAWTAYAWLTSVIDPEADAAPPSRGARAGRAGWRRQRLSAAGFLKSSPLTSDSFRDGFLHER